MEQDKKKPDLSRAWYESPEGKEISGEVERALQKRLGIDFSLPPDEKIALRRLPEAERNEYLELRRAFFENKLSVGSKSYKRYYELQGKWSAVEFTEEEEKELKEEYRKREQYSQELVKGLRNEGKTFEEISKKTELSEQEVIGILSENKTEIDIDTIELIHGIERHQDGYVSFCRKINKEHQDLAGIKVSELRQYLPEILPWILKDSYFSVNASYRSAPWINRVTGLPSPWRKEIRLRYLNACYCDIDCYKAGLDWSNAVQIILQAQDKNIIPPSSIIARSGRGIYLLWLLTSERLGAQQRAFPQEIVLYKQINKFIIRRLAEYESKLNPDHIHDAARILRVPGSIHTKANQQVNYLIQVTGGGRMPVYTLKDLAKTFNIPMIPLPTESNITWKRQIKNRGSVPAKRQGKIATGNYRMSDLLTIAQHREGFKKGKRWKSISYFCYFAKASGYTLKDIEKQAYEIAKKCKPAYPSEKNDTPVSDIVKNIWIKYTPRFNNDTLADFFKITPELAEELNLHSIIPSQTAVKRKNEPSQQAKNRQERKKVLKDILNKRPGNRPSLRKLKLMLENEGISTNKDTIRKDSTDIFKSDLNGFKQT